MSYEMFMTDSPRKPRVIQVMNCNNETKTSFLPASYVTRFLQLQIITSECKTRKNIVSVFTHEFTWCY